MKFFRALGILALNVCTLENPVGCSSNKVALAAGLDVVTSAVALPVPEHVNPILSLRYSEVYKSIGELPIEDWSFTTAPAGILNGPTQKDKDTGVTVLYKKDGINMLEVGTIAYKRAGKSNGFNLSLLGEAGVDFTIKRDMEVRRFFYEFQFKGQSYRCDIHPIKEEAIPFVERTMKWKERNGKYYLSVDGGKTYRKDAEGKINQIRTQKRVAEPVTFNQIKCMNLNAPDALVMQTKSVLKYKGNVEGMGAVLESKERRIEFFKAAKDHQVFFMWAIAGMILRF